MATITSGQTFYGQVGVPFTAVTPSHTNTIKNWRATGLPSGVTIDSTTGAISGTPIEGGSMTISVGGDGYDPAFVASGSDFNGLNSLDNKGKDVAINAAGTRVALVTPGDDTVASNAGKAEVYDWDGSQWVQVGGTIYGDSAEDYTGSVGLNASGDILAVGMPSTVSSATGKIKVFSWNGSSWAQRGAAIFGNSSERFGQRVYLNASGTRVVASSIYHNSSTGFARIFEWSGTAWVQLGSDIVGTGGGFLEAVSLNSSGDRVAVGEQWAALNGTQSGTVRIFEWSGSAWVQMGANLNGAAGDYFGINLALNAAGDRLAVVASNASSGRGVTKIFDWSGSAWVQLGGTILNEASGDGQLRMSVGMNSSGSRLVIGACGNDGGGNLSGYARVYDWDGSAWVQFGADLNGKAISSYFGFSAAMNSAGDVFIIGASPATISGASQAGYARVYKLQADGASVGVITTAATFSVAGVSAPPTPASSNNLRAYFGSTLILDTKSAVESYRSSDAYTRPTEWKGMFPAVANEIRGLYAVLDSDINILAFKLLTTDASQYYVDWGDGSAVELCNSNSVINHNYSFNAAALDGTLTTRGFKQALVRIYPQAGRTFKEAFFNSLPTSPSGFTSVYRSAWLDLDFNLPNLLATTSSFSFASSNSAVLHPLVEKIVIRSWGGLTGLAGTFTNCYSLQSLNEHEWNTANITSFQQTFFGCNAIQQLDCSNWDVSNATRIDSTFRAMTSLQRVKLNTWNTGNCTNMSAMFQDSPPLNDIDVSNWNTSKVTNMSYMFIGCGNLRKLDVSGWDTSKVTTTLSMFQSCSGLEEIDISGWNLPLCTNASGMFNACYSLRKLSTCSFAAATNLANFAINCGRLTSCTATGFNASVTFASCMLGAAQLNAIYTDLPVTATAKTITVSGNYGAAADNPSIATAKGWTVSG